MPPAALLSLLLACAPNVAPVTMARIVEVESGGDILALNINGAARQPARPSSVADAVTVAQDAIARGFSVDLGLAQVNSRNLPGLGLTLAQVLDPCTNLRAGAAILAADYAAAAARFGDGQPALQAALSAYNTGSEVRGFANGYVARYYPSVPALPSQPRHALPHPVTQSNRYAADMAVAWD